MSNSTLALLLLLAAALGIGVTLLGYALFPPAAGRLAQRVLPYVMGVSESAWRARKRMSASLFSRDFFTLLKARLTNFYQSQNSDKLNNLLQLSGRDQSAADFRLQQLAAASIVAAGVALFGGVAFVTGQANVILLVPVAFAGVFWFMEDRLKKQVKKRKAKIVEEFPSVLEFLSLSVSAGEGIIAALRRITAISSGEFSRELKQVSVGVSTGETLEKSLKTLAARLNIVVIDRAVSQIITAIERGTPLADILIKQAKEARLAGKLQLIELAGRKEIGMMVPLVFFILPVTILFAVFPGLQVLH